MTGIDQTDSDSPLWDIRGWNRLTVHNDPSLVGARNEFLSWLNNVPKAERADLQARLFSSLDHAHLSARLELFIYNYFDSNQWQVQIHPPVAHSLKHPDFLVESLDDSFLVECRSVFDREEATQQVQRLRQLADDVSRDIGRTVILHPLCDLPKSVPARRIRSWIQGLKIVDDATELLEFDFWDDHQGHHYGLRALVPKLIESGEPLTGVQGLMSQVTDVTNAQLMRSALEEKAKKYGKLELPYIIAVATETSFPTSLNHETDALFGNRVWNVPIQGVGGVTESRTPSGLFTTRRGEALEFPEVSAVLVYRFKWVGGGHVHRLHMYHNPFAVRPIDPEQFRGIPQFLRQGEDAMGWIDGEPESY